MSELEHIILGQYQGSPVHVGPLPFESGVITYLEGSAELVCHDDDGNETTPFVIAYEDICSFRIRREDQAMMISVPGDHVREWLRDNNLLDLVSTFSPDETVSLIVFLNEELINEFKAAIAPKISESRRARSSSRWSVTEPLPLPHTIVALASQMPSSLQAAAEEEEHVVPPEAEEVPAVVLTPVEAISIAMVDEQPQLLPRAGRTSHHNFSDSLPQDSPASADAENIEARTPVAPTLVTPQRADRAAPVKRPRDSALSDYVYTPHPKSRKGNPSTFNNSSGSPTSKHSPLPQGALARLAGSAVLTPHTSSTSNLPPHSQTKTSAFDTPVGKQTVCGAVLAPEKKVTTMNRSDDDEDDDAPIGALLHKITPSKTLSAAAAAAGATSTSKKHHHNDNYDFADVGALFEEKSGATALSTVIEKELKIGEKQSAGGGRSSGRSSGGKSARKSAGSANKTPNQKSSVSKKGSNTRGRFSDSVGPASVVLCPSVSVAHEDDAAPCSPLDAEGQATPPPSPAHVTSRVTIVEAPMPLAPRDVNALPPPPSLSSLKAPKSAAPLNEFPKHQPHRFAMRTPNLISPLRGPSEHPQHRRDDKSMPRRAISVVAGDQDAQDVSAIIAQGVTEDNFEYLLKCTSKIAKRVKEEKRRREMEEKLSTVQLDDCVVSLEGLLAMQAQSLELRQTEALEFFNSMAMRLAAQTQELLHGIASVQSQWKEANRIEMSMMLDTIREKFEKAALQQRLSA